MSSSIDNYLMAVAKRKAIDSKRTGQTVNFAIVAQLEGKDIPLLLEIIRVQKKAIDQVIELAQDHDDGSDEMHEMGRHCSVAHLEAEKLAAQGSTARWGDYKEEGKGNGHTTPS